MSIKNLHSSFNSVEIHTPVSGVNHEQIRVTLLTLVDNKNGCPTSSGTGTPRHQRPMFHSLNPLKTVPPLGHFQSENTQLSISINLNVVNFMSRFFIDFSPKATPKTPLFCLQSLRVAKQSWLSGLRTVNHEQIRAIALTKINNKNECNTSPVTVTLRRLCAQHQPLNLLKSVTPMLHFSHKISQFSSGTNLNVVNFMFVCMSFTLPDALCATGSPASGLNFKLYFGYLWGMCYLCGWKNDCSL